MDEELRRIFSIAKKEKNEALASRYIEIALEAARKSHIKISKELKLSYCPKCFSVFKRGNFSIRLEKGKKIVKCLKCSHVKRFPYK